SPCRPRGSSPATGSPAVTPDSAPAPRTCLLHSTLSDEIAGNKNTTRRTNPSDTCLHTQLPMGAEHQLIDGKDNSDPPYQGELRSERACGDTHIFDETPP